VPLRDGIRARSATESLYRSLRRVPRPRAGDLVFFHRSYDRDRAGPGANRFTHVGIVEKVEGPRVTVIHRSNTGVERLALNRLRPHDPAENDVLRRRRPTDPPGVRHLAGELLAGYASPWGSPVQARRGR
jgi:peptidoglycan DL-endopeptidase CwlO